MAVTAASASVEVARDQVIIKIVGAVMMATAPVVVVVVLVTVVEVAAAAAETEAQHLEQCTSTRTTVETCDRHSKGGN